MNRHLKILLGLLLISCSSVIHAEGYFTSRSYTPYPPGCVTLPSRQEALYNADVRSIWSGSMWLEKVHKVESTDPVENLSQADVEVFRVGCAEPNRSVIMVEFKLRPEWVYGYRYSQFVLPTFAGVNTAMNEVVFDLKPEPNGRGEDIQQQLSTIRSFGDYSDGWFDALELTWRYVLDMAPSGEYWSLPFLTDYYNDWIVLQPHVDGVWAGFHIEVPPTDYVMKRSSSLPLNGRLSGIWVERGTSDQGLLLTFANPVPSSDSPVTAPNLADMVIFLSWYTFDSQGQQLWLVGNTDFQAGATEVVMPLMRVTRGQFLGSRLESNPDPLAQVGEIRLRARNCNALELEYELASLGLSAGTLQLQRPAELETAAYPCRDYEARLASQSANATH